MKKMRNKKSILENTLELIADLDIELREAFIKYSTKKSGKRAQVKYLQLYTKLCEEINSGKGADEVNEYEIKDWVREDSISSNFSDLARELYEKLIHFLGEQFKKQEDMKWRIEVEQGMFAVQALIERNLFSQAAVLMKKLEEKIPQNPSNSILSDFSMLVKFSALRVQLAYRTDFIEATEEDNFLATLQRNSRYARQNPGASNLFQNHADKVFFLKIYEDSMMKNNFWEKEHRVLQNFINTIPERTESIKGYNFENIGIPSFVQPERYFETCVWSLLAYQRAIQLGFYNDAINFLTNLISHGDRGETNTLLKLATTAWVGHLIGELDLIKILNENGIKKKEEFESSEDYVPIHFQILQYTRNFVEDLAFRVEINRILMLLYSEDLEAAHINLTKMYQLDGLPIYLKDRLKLIEVWLLMMTKNSVASEEAKKTFNRFRAKKEGYHFEKAISSALFKLSSWPKHQWKNEAEKAPFMKQVKKMKTFKNNQDPLHQFFSVWINEVITDGYE